MAVLSEGLHTDPRVDTHKGIIPKIIYKCYMLTHLMTRLPIPTINNIRLLSS